MKVALIQHSFKNTRKDTMEFIASKIEESASNGAVLVLLQELHNTQYFCQEEEVETFDLGGYFQEDLAFYSDLAKKHQVVLVASLFEKRSAGLYHNTAVVFEKDGTLAGKYRKMHIPDDPNFYEKFYFTPGDLGFEPIKTSVGKLGVLVCWDQWYPEAARIMALKGAEVLIYPTAIGWFESDSLEEKTRQRDAWIAVQRGHAVANGIPVLSINRVGFEADKAGGGILFWGSSFAFGAQGELLAQATVDKEEVLYVEIDKEQSERVRRIWPFLRDRRIDNYGEILKRYCD
ncbi:MULTISPECIES: carbon-nitrogen hydrolase [unclassified Helicobacter]|uniref:carbon-nitrogen hydrolase n=1 Tax=unclassified Helicobacter TaxID=2593540 RepID=UPI000CF0F694|nr:MULTISPECIES: carbon-nitrogen hydrolase [unclassified Helicobacter]